ncbi:uncharacterized protein [Lolium perenne]|uniref:uncharacterized protein n=1 Tax=Lolium perenne TaxID=4522 RepID=UPI003A9A363E
MGVNERSNTQIQAFRETVDVCQLMDLGYTGTPWTFEKKVAGGSYCRVHLDRALATSSRCERYPLAALQHLTAVASDHSAILLRFEPILEPPLQAKLFRYEAMWETHQDFKPLMDREWRLDTCTSMHGLERKLKGLSQSLSDWGRDTFGSVCRELRDLRRQLTHLRLAPDRASPSYQELKVVERIVELQHREEVMWRQRSRIQWLAEGDRNTRFFHLRASKRKKRNKIARLKRTDGSFTEDQLELGHMAKDFYKSLYTSEGTSGMEEVLNVVPVTVTAAMNEQLLAAYGDEEIKQALFQMFPLKAPGPDGFPAQFFQKHWDVCGGEVTRAVLRILQGEESP